MIELPMICLTKQTVVAIKMPTRTHNSLGVTKLFFGANAAANTYRRIHFAEKVKYRNRVNVESTLKVAHYNIHNSTNYHMNNNNNKTYT